MPHWISIVCTSAPARARSRRAGARSGRTSGPAPGRPARAGRPAPPRCRRARCRPRGTSARWRCGTRHGRAIASVMASVMDGSNWPTSWAAIARSTRGSASTGPGPMRSRAGGWIGATTMMTLLNRVQGSQLTQRSFQSCFRISDHPSARSTRAMSLARSHEAHADRSTARGEARHRHGGPAGRAGDRRQPQRRDADGLDLRAVCVGRRGHGCRGGKHEHAVAERRVERRPARLRALPAPRRPHRP